MLLSIKKLYGNKLGESDAAIGHVKDLYFDDQSWVVRYVVADTGNWLSGRLVLVSPYACGGIDPAGKILRVNLTREQIEKSPSIDAHKPVSRQFEELYHRYYGWPYYWEGDGLWGGTRDFPVMELPAQFFPGAPAKAAVPRAKGADAHLRSTQAVNGYRIQATDGIIGYICDFMMDDKSWAIGRLVIKIGHRFSGKEVEIPTCKVNRISYDESTVFVNLTQAAVGQSPEHNPASAGAVPLVPPFPVL
jgi:hypothetical protein